MSTLAIILIVVGAVLLLLLIGGFLATRSRGTDWSARVAEADHQLEAARAADKGWDREIILAATRRALESQKPDWEYDDLHLVLVDDRPGVEEDRAHFVAVGLDGESRVILTRDAAGDWHVESVS